MAIWIKTIKLISSFYWLVWVREIHIPFYFKSVTKLRGRGETLFFTCWPHSVENFSLNLLFPHVKIPRGPALLCWHTQSFQLALHPTLHDRSCSQTYVFWSQGEFLFVTFLQELDIKLFLLFFRIISRILGILLISSRWWAASLTPRK